ncbi:type II toxin-antitoxin system death-on-curing family toxin [Anaerolineae bacterium CFX9]|nr:type II toxin-antitoxin system death-on-curing family toxin [Anaerolineae bacterium CFX9]
MRYLTLSELIYINGKVLGNEKIATGRQKVRDIDLLDAAVQRPAASAFGEDAYPTLNEKAAALLHSLARNHPFTDGNKRTSAVAAIFMLEVNGSRVIWDQAEALDRIIATAENRLDVRSLAAWLPVTPVAPAPDPDLERDTQAIARIIAEQKWLLDELQSR